MTTTTRWVELEQQNFRVDLGGVIALLSKNLYSSPGVYIRELIQNAMDAIVARDALGAAPAPRTISISPYGLASPDSPAEEFALVDAGIGVSPGQVDQFLATVGASTKREELEQSRRTYIGQFGIGLLSCFLIADEITVVSRSATGAEPIEWVGKSDGTYRVRAVGEDIPVGTTVRLRPRADMVGWVRSEQVTPCQPRDYTDDSAWDRGRSRLPIPVRCQGCGKMASILGPAVDQKTLYGAWPATGSLIRMPSRVAIAVESPWARPGARKMSSTASSTALKRSTSGLFSSSSSRVSAICE